MIALYTIVLHVRMHLYKIYALLASVGDTRWRSWLWYCATSQKVAGSIPDVVIEILL
jgi:hypothetical protein